MSIGNAITRIAVGIGVALTLTTVPLRAESPVELTVRIYNSAHLPTEEVRAARRIAEPILRDTGMAVTFRSCGARDAAGLVTDDCADRLKPSEVVVRIINAPAFNTTLHPYAYGVTYVADATHRGWLATVFADRVAVAAERVEQEPGAVLGRVLAHEVGHLFLGSGYHGDTGVMRASWSDELLQHQDEVEWRFSMREADAIQRALTAGTH